MKEKKKSLQTERPNVKVKNKEMEQSKLKNSDIERTKTSTSLQVQTAEAGKYDTANIPRLVWLVALLVGGSFGLLYAVSMSDGPSSYAFSDELISTAYNLGLSRPPGYVLYSILLHFVLNLPLPVSIALRGHILSALLQSLSLLFLFVSIWKIIDHIMRVKEDFAHVICTKKIDSLVFSGIATALAGSIPLVWVYGSIAEVPAFLSLLVSIILFCGVQIVFGTKNKPIYPIIMVVVCAIGIANNPLLLFTVPLVLFSVTYTKDRLSLPYIAKLFFLFLGTILIHIGLIFWLQNRDNQLSWYLEPNLSGLWSYMSSNSFSQNSIYIRFGKHFLDAFPIYINQLAENVGWFVIVVSIVGFRMIFNVSKKLGLFTVLSTVLVAVVFPILLSWDDNQLVQVLILRQYAFVISLIAIPFSIGIWLLASRLYKAVLILSNKENLIRIVIALLMLVPLVQRVYQNIQNYDFTQLKPFSQIHAQALHSLPDKSILVCKDDQSCASLLYAQQIQRIKPNIFVVPSQYPLLKKYIEKQKLRGFEYEHNPYIAFDYITWNINKIPVYLMGGTETHYAILGMDYGFTYYVPQGYVGQAVRKLPDSLPIMTSDISILLRKSNFKKNDPMYSTILDLTAQYHMFNALILEKMGYKDRARNELNTGTNLLYEIDSLNSDKIEAYRTSIESVSPSKSWILGTESQKAEDIIKIARQNIEYKKMQSAYVGALGAVAVSPMNLEARLLLANIYELQEKKKSALVEYKNVLKIDQGNAIAIEKIARLEAE